MAEQLAAGATATTGAPADVSDKTISDFGTNERAGEQTQTQATEVADESTEETAVQQDGDPSIDDVTGEPTQQQPLDKEARITELANEYGLDPSLPGVRKALEKQVAMELQTAAKEAHIQKIESTQVDEWIKSLDTIRDSLSKPAAAEVRTEQPRVEPRVPQVGQGSGIQWDADFEDVLKGVRNPEDWHKMQVEAYNEGDMRKASAIQEAMFIRMANRLIGPDFERLLDSRFDKFRKDDLGQIVPHVQQTMAEREMQSAMSTAAGAIKNDAKLSPVFMELMKVDQPGFIQMNGRQYPNSPFHRIMAEFPELLESVSEGAPRDVQQRQFFNIYSHALKIHMRTKQNGITPQKAKKLIASGVEQQKRESEKDAVRRTLNAGGGRSNGAPSGRKPDEWANAAQGNGESLESLFR